MKDEIKNYMTIFIICITVFNTGRMFFFHDLKFENGCFDSNITSVMQGHRWQGDYTLYVVDNNLTTFPYIFGNRLYLYSAKDGKSFLIYRQFAPFAEWSDEFTFFQDKIMGTGGIAWDIPSDQILISLNGFVKKDEQLETAYDYIMTDSGLYYTSAEYDEITGYLLDYWLFLYNYNTGESEKILKIDWLDDIAFIWHDDVFFTAEDKGNYVYHLKSKETTELDCEYPELVVEKQKDSFISIFLDGTIWESEGYNFKKRYIGCVEGVNPNDARWWDIDSAACVEEYLYLNNMEREIIRINLTDGSQETVVSLNNIPNFQSLSDWSFHISYCDNYIVYEAYYKVFNDVINRKLLTFDYEGNLIREKHLFTDSY